MINIPSTKGYKITKVYYSDRDGNIVKTNLRKLDEDENKHVSKYYKTRNFRMCSECSSDSSDSESI